MWRLPDSYYTNKVLDGTPSETGFNQSNPIFSQGEDIKLSFYLSYNNRPVDSDQSILSLVVKKLPEAENQLWVASMNDGLYIEDDAAPGYFYMLMPSEITALFLPGTYYVDVVLTEKIGTGEAVRDMRVIVMSFNFNIQLTASSPNPKLSTSSTELIDVDPATGIKTLKITSVEPTLPDSPSLVNQTPSP